MNMRCMARRLLTGSRLLVWPGRVRDGKQATIDKRVGYCANIQANALCVYYKVYGPS